MRAMDCESSEGGDQTVDLPAGMMGWPDSGSWFLLHTKSRQEKKVAETLQQLGVGVFLPVGRRPRYFGRRKLFVDLPLFSGYVFMRGRREDAFHLDRTDRIAGIIPVTNQGRLTEELWQIYCALRSGGDLEFVRHFEVGAEVEVRAGPFKGLRGIVEHRLGSGRLVLCVHCLGQAVVMQIESELLEPVRKTA